MWERKTWPTVLKASKILAFRMRTMHVSPAPLPHCGIANSSGLPVMQQNDIQHEETRLHSAQKSCRATAYISPLMAHRVRRVNARLMQTTYRPWPFPISIPLIDMIFPARIEQQNRIHSDGRYLLKKSRFSEKCIFRWKYLINLLFVVASISC